jgi:hypothetical protein
MANLVIEEDGTPEARERGVGFLLATLVEMTAGG